ncbi:hypothetical protein H9P43_009003 [Blastocladiella emersonii ATCC 22665]|nr:hypothetical protein H9P43_009003 [Blastocladiella emersonii ATCC 22665]
MDTDPQVKYAQMTEESIKACASEPVVNKYGQVSQLSADDQSKLCCVLTAFCKSGLAIEDVNSMTKAVETYRATKGTDKAQGLQVETLKALAKYCKWNGNNNLAAQYTQAKKQDAEAHLDARKAVETGALPSREDLLAAVVAAENWDTYQVSGTMRALRLYLQVVCATRSDLAFLTTKPSDKYPSYNPETKTLAGPVCVKTDGRGYGFSHVIADPKVAAALERIIAKRLADGHDLVFYNHSLDNVCDAQVNAKVRKDWSKTIALAAQDVGFKGCGVQQIRRISTSENKDAYEAVAKRAAEMGHSVPVAVAHYLV